MTKHGRHSLWSPETGSHGSLLNPRNLCRGGRVAVETCPKGYLSLPPFSTPLRPTYARSTRLHRANERWHTAFSPLCTTGTQHAYIAFFFLLLLLDNVYAPEARQTNRRSTCVLMNAVFDLEWWTPSGLRGFKTKRNIVEKLWRGEGERDFVCNTVPWIDLMRIRGYWCSGSMGISSRSKVAFGCFLG